MISTLFNRIRIQLLGNRNTRKTFVTFKYRAWDEASHHMQLAKQS